MYDNVLNFVVFFLSILSASLCLYIYSRSNSFPPLFGIANFFLFNYIIFIYIGSLLLILKLDIISVDILGMVNDNVLREIIFLTTIFFLFFLISVSLSDYIFKINGKTLSVWLEKDISSFFSDLLIPALLLIFIFCLGIFLFYLSKIPMIPILAVFKGGPDLMTLRSEAVGELFEGGKIWWYRYFYLDIPVFLSYIAFIETLASKTLKWKIISFIIISYCIFVNVFDLQKAPILFYLLSLFLIYVYIYKKKEKIPFEWFIVIGTSGFILLIIMYVFFMKRDFNTAMMEGIHRVLTGQLQGLYGIIENFSHNPLMGKTLPPFILKLFNIEFYDLDQEMKLYIHEGKTSSTIIGRAPTVYFGEVYANFGLFVCLISMTLIPFILRIIDNIFLKWFPKNPVTLGFYMFSIWHFKDLALGRLSPYIVDVSIFIIIFLVIFFYLCKKSLAILIKTLIIR